MKISLLLDIVLIDFTLFYLFESAMILFVLEKTQLLFYLARVEDNN